MLSGAGNVQVAATAVGFTTMFFIIVGLTAALLLGYGRRPGNSRNAPLRSAQAVREDWPVPGRDTGPIPAPVLLQPPPGLLLPPDEEEKPVGTELHGHKFGVSRRKGHMSVEVNPNKCARFGFCEHEAPDVFYLESDGRFGYETSVPVEKMERVISAMDVCPRRAIKVKLPPEQAEERVRPSVPPEDARRTIIPIFKDRPPEPPFIDQTIAQTTVQAPEPPFIDQPPRSLFTDRLPDDPGPFPRRA